MTERVLSSVVQCCPSEGETTVDECGLSPEGGQHSNRHVSGTGQHCEADQRDNTRGTTHEGQHTVLRPYQAAAVDAIRARYVAGDRATLLVLATGLGKTVIAAEVARRTASRGNRVLFLAHRSELLLQARNKMRAVGLWAQLEKAERRAGDAEVVVASVQTLKGKRLAGWPEDAFGMIIVDEAHHATSSGYKAVLARFRRARVLGLTATPDRLDGKALGAIFVSVAFRYEIREGIRDGYLAPIRARRVEVAGVDLAEVHAHHGDLDRGELSAILTEEQALHGVARPLLELSGDRRTLLFAVDVAHAYQLAEVLNRYQPGVARAIHGDMDERDRAEAIGEHRAGTVRILVNVALLTEGYDDPAISCIGMARPTQSRGLYAQCVGRGTRIAPGKADLLVLDFVGNTGRHRLIGPADVLAGRALEDAELAALDAIASGDQDLDLDHALELAEQACAESRARSRVTAIARYQADEVDPFLGEQLALVPLNTAWIGEPATVAQRKALLEAGLSKLPDDLSKALASRWLGAIAKRRELRLATLKQVRFLARYGIDARQLPMVQATQRFLEIKARGFRP